MRAMSTLRLMPACDPVPTDSFPLSWEFSPLTGCTSGPEGRPLFPMYFPPALIITAEEDSLAEEGEVFYKKLKAAGVKAEYRKFMGCSHGFTHFRIPEAGEAWELMADFLDKTLK